MLQRLIIIVVMLVCCFASGPAAAQDAIGTVSRIQGEANGTRNGATRALDLNASVFRNETVVTAETARLEVTFTDNTRLTLGERAKLTLDSYVFDSAAGRGTIKFGLVGAFRFVSGQLSKLASADVSVTTPVAVVGIRGTEFWGGPIDDQVLGVFLIDGAVSVTNAAGQQILNLPGQGTNIAAPGAAPRAGDLLGAGQGRPRHSNRGVPIGRGRSRRREAPKAHHSSRLAESTPLCRRSQAPARNCA
jgi:hypothetical protein